jgi:hypothetical protein
LGVLVGWGVAQVATARPAGAHLQALTPPATRQGLQALLDQVAAWPPVSAQAISQRVVALSAAFLGRPYAWNPTGEGMASALDTDPPVDLARHDCVTLVETVLALARSQTLEQVFDTLAVLRYGAAAASFENRTHFVTVDWWPVAREAGLLAEVPLGLEPLRLSAMVDKAAWVDALPRHPMYRRALAAQPATVRQELADWSRRLRRGGAGAAAATGELRAWPAGALLQAARSGASGTALWQSGDLWAIARPDAVLTQAAGAGDPIAHMGFVVSTPGGWVLRSASLQERGVTDVPIASALRTSPKQGAVSGVAVWRLLPRI